MKQFIVPAFMVVSADSVQVADQMAAQLQAMPGFRNGVALLLDEQLDTREIQQADLSEIHSIRDVYDIPAESVEVAPHANTGSDLDSLRALCAQLLGDLKLRVVDRADSNLPEWERMADKLGVAL